MTEDVRARSLHKERERQRKKERAHEKEGMRVEKKGAGEKDTNALSPSLCLSSSPSFGHSTTYAEVGRRTTTERERERENIYREKKSLVRSELLPSRTTTTTAVRKKTMLICEIRKAINRH